MLTKSVEFVRHFNEGRENQFVLLAANFKFPTKTVHKIHRRFKLQAYKTQHPVQAMEQDEGPRQKEHAVECLRRCIQKFPD
jgi:hypothetical protein